MATCFGRIRGHITKPRMRQQQKSTKSRQRVLSGGLIINSNPSYLSVPSVGSVVVYSFLQVILHRIKVRLGS